MLVLGLIILALIFSSRDAAAQTEPGVLDRILQTRVLRVGTTGDYPPFSFLDPTGAYNGVDIELSRSLAQSMGVEATLIRTTWPTLMQDYESGKFDVAMGGISKTPEREKKAFFSRGYYKTGKTPIARCTDKGKFDSLEKINRTEVTVIVNPGGTNQKFVAENFGKAKVVIHSDNTTIFSQIIVGKADVMITDSVEVMLQSRLHPELCGTMPGKDLEPVEKGILMSKDIALKARIDQWLDNLETQGALGPIFRKYLGEQLPTTPQDLLDGYRTRIDAFDRLIVGLLNERARIVLNVGEQRRLLRLPILAPKREQEVLTNVTQTNAGPLSVDSVTAIYKQIMTEMRRIQK